MAALAGCLFVIATQGKPCSLFMIKGRLVEAFGGVALLAGPEIPMGLISLLCMACTTSAGSGKEFCFSLPGGGFMTPYTGDFQVFIGEGEPTLFVVVEAVGFPTQGIVTLTAFTNAVVLQVFKVTTTASARCVGEIEVFMARQAFKGLVLTGKGTGASFVFEFCREKTRHRMACFAGGTGTPMCF
jgi:hypothetical protein